jgi:hypothetical protein
LYEGEYDTNQFQLSVNAAANFLFRIPVEHLTLDSEVKAGRFFEMPATAHPTIRRHISEERNPQFTSVKKKLEIRTAFFCFQAVGWSGHCV